MFDEPKKQVSTLVISSLLSLVSLLGIVFFTDPYQNGVSTKIFFFISLFLFSFGALTLLGLYIRQKVVKNLYIISLKNSLRQAFLIASFICATFLLSAQGIAYWWVQASLILFLTSFEIFISLKL
jgi:hypothetical protein